jgi:homoserine kinase type II
MAVYTPVTESQLSDYLAAYNVGGLRSFEGIRQGVENTNYHVFTEQGRFILTLFEKRVDPADLPFFFAFTEHLAAQGVPCPRGVPDHNGRVLRQLAGRPAVMVTYLDGFDVKPAEITAGHCGAAGALAASMHKGAEGFVLRRPNDLSLPGWKSLYMATMAKADDVIPGLVKTIADEIGYLEGAWPIYLPQGVVHADLFPDNVLFDKYDVKGVIDFYFSCNDYYAYDLAILINAWCFDAGGVLRRDRLEALMIGYESVRPLEDIERAAMPDLVRGAALRFLLTRLYDWVNHDPAAVVTPKEPHEYYAKLIYHQNEKLVC